MDGTLCDTRPIVGLVEPDVPIGTVFEIGGKTFTKSTTKDFPAFHAASAYCPPNDWVVKEARKHHQSGFTVCVLTGRMAAFRDLTAGWLRKHDIPFRWLLTRKDADYRPDDVIKGEMLQLLLDAGYVILHAWDDRNSVIRVWESHDIPTTKVSQE